MAPGAARSGLLRPYRNVARVLADGIVLERGWLRRAARLLVVVLREVEQWPERTADCPYRRFAFRGGVLGFLPRSISWHRADRDELYVSPDIGTGPGGWPE